MWNSSTFMKLCQLLGKISDQILIVKVLTMKSQYIPRVLVRRVTGQVHINICCQIDVLILSKEQSGRRPSGHLIELYNIISFIIKHMKIYYALLVGLKRMHSHLTRVQSFDTNANYKLRAYAFKISSVLTFCKVLL